MGTSLHFASLTDTRRRRKPGAGLRSPRDRRVTAIRPRTWSPPPADPAANTCSPSPSAARCSTPCEVSPRIATRCVYWWALRPVGGPRPGTRRGDAHVGGYGDTVLLARDDAGRYRRSHTWR